MEVHPHFRFDPNMDYHRYAKGIHRFNCITEEEMYEELMREIDWNTYPVRNIGQFRGMLKKWEDKYKTFNVYSKLNVEDPNTLSMRTVFHNHLPASLEPLINTEISSVEAFWLPLYAKGVIEERELFYARIYENGPKNFGDVLELVNDHYPKWGPITTAAQVLEIQAMYVDDYFLPYTIQPIDFAADYVELTREQITEAGHRRAFEKQNGLQKKMPDTWEKISGVKRPFYNWRPYTLSKLIDLIEIKNIEHPFNVFPQEDSDRSC